METKTVITIGRQYGSAGRQIGRALAEELGIKCYDKELLDRAAKDSGMCQELFENHDEKFPVLSGHGYVFLRLFFFRFFRYADQSEGFSCTV